MLYSDIPNDIPIQNRSDALCSKGVGRALRRYACFWSLILCDRGRIIKQIRMKKTIATIE